MDKETLGQYGWLVVCVIIMAIIITLATPFGSVIRNAVADVVTDFNGIADDALSGIEANESFGDGGSGGSGGGSGEPGMGEPGGESGDEAIVMLDGDGQTYHTMAPTPLSFRSSANIDDFNAVTINGEVVDPMYYTVSEGSTIITLSIDYLKTLNVDSYDISIVSDSGAPTAGFSVVEPQLNEHGFYFNQPYIGSVPGFDSCVAFILFFLIFFLLKTRRRWKAWQCCSVQAQAFHCPCQEGRGPPHPVPREWLGCSFAR